MGKLAELSQSDAEPGPQIWGLQEQALQEELSDVLIYLGAQVAHFHVDYLEQYSPKGSPTNDVTQSICPEVLPLSTKTCPMRPSLETAVGSENPDAELETQTHTNNKNHQTSP